MVAHHSPSALNPPTSPPGLARCQTSQCCSQYGRCENVCSSTCQCEFSGRRSYCPGSTLLTNLGVPVAPSGGICGQGVATCPAGECCSVLSYCTTNCAATPCSVAESGSGSACRGECEVGGVAAALLLRGGGAWADGLATVAV